MSYIINSYRFAGFDILDLNPLQWLKYDDVTITSSPDVDSVNDKSGNGYDFTQSTAASKPHLNGQNIEFDTVDDFLTSSNVAALKSPTEGEIIGVIYIDPVEAAQNIYCFSGASSTNRLLCTAHDGQLSIFSQDNSSTQNFIKASSAVGSAGYYIVSWTGDNTAYELFVNDPSTSETLTISSGSNTGTWVGSYADPTKITAIRIAQQALGGAPYTLADFKEIIYFDTKLTTSERTDIFNLLNDEYSIY